MGDDLTYRNRLGLLAENALMPLWSLKEMLLDMSEGEATISPSHLAEVLESLLKQAESQFDAAEAALDKHVGHIQFVRACAGYAGAPTGTIVEVKVEPREGPPMPDANTDYEPYFLADRIHSRATFVAELLKLYPSVPSEQGMTGMWTILEDIAADAKRVMQAIDPANALVGKGQNTITGQGASHA